MTPIKTTSAAILALLATAPAAAIRDVQEPPAAPELALRIERVPAPELHVAVHLALAGNADGATDLAVAESWGGIDAGGRDLADLRAVGADGEALEVERPAPHRWRVRHEPGEALQVSYRIPRNDYRSASDPGTNRRPIVDEVFHAFGELFLALPEHLDPKKPHSVSVGWTGFGEDAAMACSFGVGRGPIVFEASLAELRHSVFLGGDVTLERRDVLGAPVWLAAHDRGWGFEISAFADLVATVFEVERAFFDDTERPFYLVTLIPVGGPRPGSMSLGGTGLTDSFALMIQPGLGLERGGDGYLQIVRLLAHELFHEWNGAVLGREQPEELVYWFSEGFTDFYARRLLLRGGLIGVDDWVRSANEALRAHFTSPVRGEPNERIRADYWADPAVQKLPYHRGDVVAMMVDGAIRRRSQGAQSLDDLMRAWVERGREGWEVSTPALLEEIGRWASPEVAETVRAVVEDGAAPALDPATFAPCLTLSVESVEPFDLGFDLARSMREQTVRDVRPDGPAHAAGLRDGQPLTGWSVRHGDTEAPVRFVIRVDGAERTIEYPAVGEPLPVPRFTRVPGIDAGSCDVL